MNTGHNNGKTNITMKLTKTKVLLSHTSDKFINQIQTSGEYVFIFSIQHYFTSGHEKYIVHNILYLNISSIYIILK